MFNERAVLWAFLDKELAELEEHHINSLISKKEYKEMVRAQETIKAVRSLRSLKDKFVKE